MFKGRLSQHDATCRWGDVCLTQRTSTLFPFSRPSLPFFLGTLLLRAHISSFAFFSSVSTARASMAQLSLLFGVAERGHMCHARSTLKGKTKHLTDGATVRDVSCLHNCDIDHPEGP